MLKQVFLWEECGIIFAPPITTFKSSQPPLTTYHLIARLVYLEPHRQEYLCNLPEYSIQHFDSVNILLSHYVMPNLVGDSKEWTAEKKGMEEHFAFMKENDCQISVFAHDLQSGVRMFHEGGDPDNLPFGKHALKDFPIALNSSWIANGTEENGVMILDTEEVSIEAIPLGTPPHIVPDWFEK
ncbi:hypothetical protein KBC70_03900 [Candidatus Woesebacteria bacterium]|nr:hypothetical protein [Candidatus Woesebacteria bacterium]